MRAMKFLIGSAIMLTLAFALAFLSIFFAEPGHSQTAPQCADHAAVTEGLLRNYGEVPAITGVVGNGEALMQVFVNPETTSWTIVYTAPDGNACLMGSGVGFAGEPNV